MAPKKPDANASVDDLTDDSSSLKFLGFSKKLCSASKIDVNKVRCLAKYLNAIRGSKNDKIDIGAGMKFYKKIGDYIKKGEIIGYIETNNEVKIEEATKQMKDSITLSQKRIRVKNYVVYEI